MTFNQTETFLKRIAEALEKIERNTRPPAKDFIRDDRVIEGWGNDWPTH